jgi:hypothetical protein
MQVPPESRTHAEARTALLLPCTTVTWQRRGFSAEVTPPMPVTCSGATVTVPLELATVTPLPFNIAKLTAMSFAPTFVTAHPNELAPVASSGAVVRKGAPLATPPKSKTIAKTETPLWARVDISVLLSP